MLDLGAKAGEGVEINPHAFAEESAEAASPDVPEPITGFDVVRFQRAQAARAPAEATSERHGSSAGARLQPPRGRRTERQARREAWDRLTRTAAAALAAMRRVPLTPVHWALVLAIALAIGQAVFIALRLTGARTSSVAAASVPQPTPAIEREIPREEAAPSAPVSTLGSTRAVPAPERRQTAPARAAPAVSRLVVRSDPPGAKVSVDGRPRGTTPLTLVGVSPGRHKVVVHGPAGPVEHDVTAEAGATATVLASLSPGAVGGWLSVSAPAALQIFEGTELLGTSATPRLMLPAGRHALDLVNEELGYRSRHVVEISAGGVVRLTPEMPAGTVHLNALPWAEVWIDGRKIGVTPLGNLRLPIGPHEVVFRNPEFPEVTRTVVATLHGPARLSVTLGQERR